MVNHLMMHLSTSLLSFCCGGHGLGWARVVVVAIVVVVVVVVVVDDDDVVVAAAAAYIFI